MRSVVLARKVVAKEIQKNHLPPSDSTLKIYTEIPEWAHNGQLAVWESNASDPVACAGSQGGKALALDTIIPTPTGFTTMGELQIGDYVLGDDGKATKVIATSEIFTDHECYQLNFDDGTKVIADAGHRWVTHADYSEIVTTETIANSRNPIRVPSLNGPRLITSCISVPSVPVKCIAVDNESHQFLCTEAYIATHNTAIEPWWLIREIQRCAPLVIRGGGGKFLYVGPTLTLLSEQAIPTFKQCFVNEECLGKLIEGNKPRFKFSQDGLRKVFGRGNLDVTISFAYANDSSNLESMTALAGVWDEAGQKENKQASYQAFNRRLKVARSTSFHKVLKFAPEWWLENYYDVEGADSRFGRRLWGTTPYEWGWFKAEVYDKGVKGVGGFESFNWPSWENPFVDEAECRKELEMMPEWQWQMMYMGMFTRPAGIIYDTFDYEEDTCDDFTIHPSWKIEPGVDFGGINTAGVLIAENPLTGQLYGIHEYHAGRQKTYPEHVTGIVGPYVNRVGTGAGGSHQEDGWREAFRANNLPLDEPPINSVDVGIGCVYAVIKTHRIRFFRQSCQKLIADLQHYSRAIGPDGQPIDGVQDKAKYHLADALRYIITKLRPNYSQPRGADPLIRNSAGRPALAMATPQGTIMRHTEDGGFIIRAPAMRGLRTIH